MEEHPTLLGQNGRAWARLPAFTGVTEFSGIRMRGGAAPDDLHLRGAVLPKTMEGRFGCSLVLEFGQLL